MCSRDAISTARSTLPTHVRASPSCPNANAMNKSYNLYKLKANVDLGDRGLDDANPLRIILPNYLMDDMILDTVVRIGNTDKRMFVFCTAFGRQLLINHRQQYVEV